MVEIKKIYDDAAMTDQVYPQTHEKAVVDNNGTTSETKFQMITDLVNQKQMEIGAVPSDLVPTAESTNWVTSGGVFDALESRETIDLSELTFKNYFVNSNNKWEISINNNYGGVFLSVMPYETYILRYNDDTSTVICSILKTNTIVNGQSPDFSSEYPSRIIYEAGKTFVVTIPPDAHYIWIRTKNVGIEAPPIVEKTFEKYSRKSEVLSMYEDITDEVLSMYEYINNNVYALENADFLGNTATLNYWIGTSKKWNEKSSQYPYYCRILKVEANKKYKITAGNARPVNYALLSNGTPVANTQATDWNDGVPKILQVGESVYIDTGVYEYLYCRWDETIYDYPSKVEKAVNIQDVIDAEKQVSKKKIEIEYGFITATGNSAGFNSPNKGENYDYKYWRSCGMISVEGGEEYEISTDVAAGYIRFYWYNKNRGYIGETTVLSPTIGDDGLYHASSNAEGHYMRICINYETEYAPKAYLKGILEDNWKSKLSGVAPSGSAINFLVNTYYQTLNSDIEETESIQDVGYKLINRGLLKLPTNYDPDGEPSRLVIYCHGADGFHNWNNNTTSFDVDHIDPTLWVNSGYAVMDMDDLTRTTYLQGQDIPTLLTQNCYMEGYEHVLRNYNIRKDGVILCGRSLGGQRVMMLLDSQLPTLCCCLIAPSCGFSRYWNMADRRRITTVYNNFPTTIDIDGVETEINWGNTNAISDIEWAAMQKYYRLVLNTHGILKLLCINKSDFFATHTINGVEVSLRSNPEIWDREVFTNWVGKTGVPIKIWYADDDDTLPDPTRNQDLLVAIAGNGGDVCEYHIMEDGGHWPERDGATVDYTNKYGVTYEDVSLVYAEMLQFIRRYEQNL